MSMTRISLNKSLLCWLVIGLSVISVAGQEAQRDGQTPKVIRKSGGVLQGSAIKRVEPVYPPLAKAAQVSGSVVVEMTVDETGNVVSTRAISGHPLLKDSAITAAREWVFTPTELQGVPVKVIGTITFNFTLDNAEQIAALEAKVRANPDSAEALKQLADAYSYSLRYEEAVSTYRAAIKIKEDYPAAYFGLGQACDRLGRYNDARDAYLQAVRLNSGVDFAGNAGNPISSLPDNAHLFISQFHYRRGEYQDAVDALKQAALMFPNLDIIRMYLATNYVALGDKQAAMAEYNALQDKQSADAAGLLRLIEKKE